MTDLAKIAFAKPGRKPAGTIVMFAGPDVALVNSSKHPIEGDDALPFRNVLLQACHERLRIFA